MRPSLIQMGVWCASASDVQPRERKTGCAWTDNRESSDASTRRRFRTPLDKGPVNGRPLLRPWAKAASRLLFWPSACLQTEVPWEIIRKNLLRLAETVDIDHSLRKGLRGFLRQIVTDATG